MDSLSKLSSSQFDRLEGGRLSFSGSAQEAREALGQIATLVTSKGTPKEGYLKIRAGADGVSLGLRWLKGESSETRYAAEVVKSLVGKAYGDRPGVSEALTTYLQASGGKVGTRSILKMLRSIDPGNAPALNDQNIRSKFETADLHNANALRALKSRIDDLRDRQAPSLSEMEPTRAALLAPDNGRIFELHSLAALRTECAAAKESGSESQKAEAFRLQAEVEKLVDDRLQALPSHLCQQIGLFQSGLKAGVLTAERVEGAFSEMIAELKTLERLVDKMTIKSKIKLETALSNPGLWAAFEQFTQGVGKGEIPLDLEQRLQLGRLEGNHFIGVLTKDEARDAMKNGIVAWLDHGGKNYEEDLALLKDIAAFSSQLSGAIGLDRKRAGKDRMGVEDLEEARSAIVNSLIEEHEGAVSESRRKDWIAAITNSPALRVLIMANGPMNDAMLEQDVRKYRSNRLESLNDLVRTATTQAEILWREMKIPGQININQMALPGSIDEQRVNELVR